MKNKLSVPLSLLLCILLVMSIFTACSTKKNNEESTTLTPDDNWHAGTEEVYQPVELTGDELVDLVERVLGDEAKDFSGNLSDLTAEQLSKIKQAAATEGLVIKEDEDGNTVIIRDNVPVTEANSKLVEEILSKADLSNTTKISKSEYEKVSKEAESKGVTAVTDEKGNVTIFSKVPTTKPKTTKPTGSSDPNISSEVVKTSSTKPTTTKATTTRTTSSGKVYTNPGGQTGTSSPITYSEMYTATQIVKTNSVDKVYGKTFSPKFHTIFSANTLTPDGGVVCAGLTLTDDNNKRSSNSSALIVKFNSDGATVWNHRLSGNELVVYEDVAVLPDGSIIAVGQTLATDLVDNALYKCKGTVEGIMSKYSADGKLLWTKIFGGSQSDHIYTVEPHGDGFVIGGKTESKDADLSGTGDTKIKAYVAKFSASGEKQWVRAIGGTIHNAVFDLACTSGGTIYAAIESKCNDGDYAGLPGVEDARTYTVAMKLSAGGNVSWKQSIYETGEVSLKKICITPDGGCVLAGQYSTNRKGETTGTFASLYNGGQPGTLDGVIVKYETSGKLAWITPLIGFENDFITDITPCAGGFAVTGFTASSNRDFVYTNKGDFDSFVYVISYHGDKQKSASIAGSSTDRAAGICANGKNLYVCGFTTSADGAFASCNPKPGSEDSVAFLFKYTLSQS